MNTIISFREARPFKTIDTTLESELDQSFRETRTYKTIDVFLESELDHSFREARPL